MGDHALSFAFTFLGVLLPLWVICGMMDWRFHRRSHIATTSGWPESFLHLVLTAELGAAVLAGLFLEINSLVLIFIMAMFAAHEVTTSWDIRYASRTRVIVAGEQRIHDYLTALPCAVLSIVLITYSEQVLSLLGVGTRDRDFSLSWKRDPFPVWYLAAFLVFSSINAVLYFEEFVRGIRARRT